MAKIKKIKRRCKFSYAMATRSGNAQGTHRSKVDYKRPQGNVDWLEEWGEDLDVDEQEEENTEEECQPY